MEEQLNKIYEAQITALQNELQLTRQFIYREFSVGKQISAETTQAMIDQYIKRKKEEAL